jgi:tetratricopeptide (TPR) repeat protein
MAENATFYTATMAKIYANQGELDKAAKIYRYLIKQDPDRQDLVQALLEIEKKSNKEGAIDLILLFSQWVELALVYRKKKRLRKIKKILQESFLR